MRDGIERWMRAAFGWTRPGGISSEDRHFLSETASAMRIGIPAGQNDQNKLTFLVQRLNTDQDLYLDCIDFVLHSRKASANTLRRLLAVGGSVWAVSDDGHSLVRRVSAEAQASMSRASSPRDSVSDELAQAWDRAYGRSPDPSDAWDHAIKAVEDLLIPIVVPAKAKANLGDVAGQLKANSSAWTIGLATNGDLDEGRTLEALVRLIWPNPDRHGGSGKRTPTLEEAESVVQTAVYIVNLCRAGLRKK